MTERDPTRDFNRAGKFDDLKHARTPDEQRRILEIDRFHRAASERGTKFYEKNYPRWVQKEIARIWKERDKPKLEPPPFDRDRSKTAKSIEAEAARRVQHRQQRRADRIVQWRQREIENPRQMARSGPEQGRGHGGEPVRQPPAPQPEKKPIVSEWRRTAELRKAAHAERAATQQKEGGRER